MNKDKQRPYTSPEAEVIDTQVRTVICQSTPNSTDPYERENW